MEELKAKVNSVIINRKKQRTAVLWETAERITNSIEETENGEETVLAIVERKALNYKLTNREKEIVKLILDGSEYKEISGKLFISMNTVTSHIQHIYEKLNVHSKVELFKIFSKS